VTPATDDAGPEPRKPTILADGAAVDAFVAANRLALVELYTSGCGICASMEPVLGIVAKASDAAVGLVNAGDDLDLAARFSVRSVPTLLLFEDGELIERWESGFVGADVLIEAIADRSG